MKRGIFTVAAVAAIAIITPGAVADPATPPTMSAAGGVQRGSMSQVYKGTYEKDGSCWAATRYGTGRVPQAVKHDGGPLRWRIPDARRPQVTLEVAPRVVPEPLGLPAKSLRVSLAPVRSRGGKVVAWTATSEPVGMGDLRLALTLRWTGPCSDGDEARWVYHVRSLTRSNG